MTDLKPIRNNYIFIDFENVQPASFDIPDNLSFKVILLVGAKQTRIPIELVRSMQKLGKNAKYITINGCGKNALDFHLTFYLGKIYQEDPNAYFHIISKDTGYDLLIDHLKSEKALVNRYSSIEDIPIIKKSKFEQLTSEEQISIISDYLAKKEVGKPGKVESLANVIMSLSGRTLSENKIKSLIQALSQKGFIRINGTQLSYPSLTTASKIKSTQIEFNTQSTSKQVQWVINSLIKKGTSKPGKIETLSNTIIDIAKRTITEDKAKILINILKQKKLITVIDNKISYQLTGEKATPSTTPVFNSMSKNKQIERITKYLKHRGDAKPKKTETLLNTIISVSGKSISKEKAESLINLLSQKGLITIKESRVSYQL